MIDNKNKGNKIELTTSRNGSVVSTETRTPGTEYTVHAENNSIGEFIYDDIPTVTSFKDGDWHIWSISSEPQVFTVPRSFLFKLKERNFSASFVFFPPIDAGKKFNSFVPSLCEDEVRQHLIGIPIQDCIVTLDHNYCFNLTTFEIKVKLK